MNLYFDSTATTKVCEQGIEAMVNVMAQHYGNPSSKHFKGMHAEACVESGRQKIAKAIGCQKDEVYYTSGGTESNNLAVFGVARAYHRQGKHIITTEIEHPSVGNTFVQLEEEGFEVTFLPVDENGFVSLEEVKKAIKKETILISVMQVNNEIGTIQPIQEIGQYLKKEHPHVLFHVDGVQGFMKFPVSMKTNGIDLYSASSHKIEGPKGIGFLYIRNKTKIKPLQYGGGQQKGIRPGTENVPGIAGFNSAIEIHENELEAHYNKVLELKKYLYEQIRGRLPDWEFNSEESNGKYEEEIMSPYIVSFRTKSIKGEVMLHALEDYGICVSTGSACSSKKLNVSHVLAAVGLSDEENDRTIRVSLNYEHSMEDIDKLIDSMCVTNSMFGRFVKK